jgi:hypothetical protein
MPYVAWMEIVPAIRMAVDKGLFGDWVPGNKKKESLYGVGSVIGSTGVCETPSAGFEPLPSPQS